MDDQQMQQQAYEDALVADHHRRSIAEAAAISGVFGAIAALACALVAPGRRIKRVS